MGGKRSGRKPIPTLVKLKKGTLEKSRIRDDEFTPPVRVELPEPPEWLDDVGKNEWRQKTKALASMHMLTDIDLTTLAVYCNQYSVYREAEHKLRQNSRVIFYTDENGRVKYAQTVPYQKIANQALELMHKLGTSLGFNPSGRTAISDMVMRGQKIQTPKKDDPPKLRTG